MFCVLKGIAVPQISTITTEEMPKIANSKTNGNSFKNFSDSFNPTFSTWKSKESKEPQAITLHDFAERCRSDRKLRDTPKDRLPCITPAGLFEGPRRAENCIHRTGLVFVDIDKKHQPKYAKEQSIPWAYFDLLRRDPHVILVKRSYSGGLHILLLAEDPAFARQYIERRTGLKTDPAAGRVVNDNCFYSYDPHLHLADQALVLKGILKPPAPTVSLPLGEPKPGDLKRAEQILKHRGMAFVEGQRNPYLYHLALLLHDRGHSESQAIATIGERYQDHRLEATVRNAYRYAKGPTRAAYTPLEISDRITCEWGSDAVPELVKRMTPGVITVVKARTAAGKTTMIPKLAGALNLPVLAVFPFQAQVQQRHGYEQLYQGSRPNKNAHLIASTWDRSVEVDVKNRLVIFDECDSAITDNTPGFREGTIWGTMQHIMQGHQVVFMSATPEPMIEALELLGLRYKVVELDTPARTGLSYSVHHMKDGNLAGFVKGATLVFRDSKAKNAELAERLVMAGTEREKIALIDADNGEEIFHYIGKNERLPDQVETAIVTRKMIRGVNIKKAGAIRVVVVDPQNFADVRQVVGRFEGGRGADNLHLDVVFTEKRRSREKKDFEDLNRHWLDLVKGTMFDPATMEAMISTQDAAVPISKHLRNGKEWAACYHAIADNMDQLEDYLTQQGFMELEATECATAPQVGPSTDQVEQRRQVWIATMQDNLPAAIGWKRAQRILQQPRKYSHIAQEAAGRAKADDPGLPAPAESFLMCLIRTGGLLDTFSEETAFAILKATKQPEKVLKLHNERRKILHGLNSQDPSGKAWREDAAKYHNALDIGETYTRDEIEKMTREHLGKHVRELPNKPADWWKLARMWWNLAPTSNKRKYKVWGFLALDAQIINGERLKLKAPETLDFAQKTLNKDSAQQLKPKTTSKTYTGIGGILK